jgi:hypothetical protein
VGAGAFFSLFDGFRLKPYTPPQQPELGGCFFALVLPGGNSCAAVTSGFQGGLLQQYASLSHAPHGRTAGAAALQQYGIPDQHFYREWEGLQRFF